MKYFQLFSFDGGANQIKYDDGLKSTETEKKRLIAIHVELEKYAGNEACSIQGWHERAKIFEFPEKLFATELKTAITMSAAGDKMRSIPVDLDIPVGETFKIAISCAAIAIAIRGVYEYEIIK